MNKIVWVMGQSAAGKGTFIKYAVANPDCELMRQLGYGNSKFIPIEESLWGDERTEIIGAVLDLISKEENAVILLKWQYTDNDEHFDVIRKLNAATPDVPNEIIMLSVESDVLFARLPNKRWQSLGLIFTAEIDATDGYKIIENSLLKIV